VWYTTLDMIGIGRHKFIQILSAAVVIFAPLLVFKSSRLVPGLAAANGDAS